MAGCALIDGDDDLIRHNLITTAAGPHWRNTWLFAAGRLYTGGDHHRGLVLDIIDRCDELGHWPGCLYKTAPELAADMLDDGMAATRPNDERRLIEFVLRSVDGPVPEDEGLKAIVRGLRAAANNNADHRFMIRNTLRNAVNTSGVGQSVAANLLTYGQSFGSTIPGLPEDMHRFVDMWRYQHPTGTKVRVGQLLREALSEAGAGEDYPARALIERALLECDRLMLRRTASDDLWSVSSGQGLDCAGLHEALNDRDAAVVLELALEKLRPGDWAARSMLARAYWPVVARSPVGPRLHTTGEQVCVSDTGQPRRGQP